MFPLEVMQKIKAIQQAIARGQGPSVVKDVDDLCDWYFKMRSAMNPIESMGFLGGLADLYSQLGQTEKEIPLWEDLCQMAEADFERLGIMASSEDCIMTGFDFLRLGRAYRKQGRTDAAREAFAKSARFLKYVDIKPDIDLLLSSDAPVFVGEYDGRKFHVI